MARQPQQNSMTADSSIDQLAINTIRTLAMDAVQTAKSGHPGTPMALAPVAYTLWNDVLRYDPDDPALAGSRSLRAVVRPCLDAALCAAAPGRREADGPTASRPASWPCRWTESRSFRQLHSRYAGPSRARAHDRRRNHHRAAGPGLRQQRGHGDRPALAGGALQSARLRAVRLQHLRVVQRRRHDGRRGQRSRLAGRAT